MRRALGKFIWIGLALASLQSSGSAEPAAQTPAAAGPPALISRLLGAGINVSDIDRSIKFYTQVIGLKVALQTPSKDGQREVALSLDGSLMNGTVLVLAHLDDKPLPQGHESFGRIITNATSAAAVAERAKALGYAVKQMAGTPVVFITDPDGYGVEVYQPSPNGPH
jgi:lactoylglutathione lyase